MQIISLACRRPSVETLCDTALDANLSCMSVMSSNVGVNTIDNNMSMN